MRAVSVSSPSNALPWKGMSAALIENSMGNVAAGNFFTATSDPRTFGLSEIRRAVRNNVPLGFAFAIAFDISILPVIVPPGAGGAAASAGAAGAAGAAGGAVGA